VLLLTRHCFTEQHKLHGDEEVLHIHSNRLQQRLLMPVWLSRRAFMSASKVLFQPPSCVGEADASVLSACFGYYTWCC
jgi:hypothetical protein